MLNDEERRELRDALQRLEDVTNTIMIGCPAIDELSAAMFKVRDLHIFGRSAGP